MMYSQRPSSGLKARLGLLALCLGWLCAARTATGQTFATTTAPTNWAGAAATKPLVADLDQDGFADMVFAMTAPFGAAPTTLVAAYFAPGLNPAVTLTAPTTIASLSVIPNTQTIKRLALANFDGDPSPDLILDTVATSGAYETWGMINPGNGVFVFAFLIYANASPYLTRLGDFDGDGLSDLVAYQAIGQVSELTILSPASGQWAPIFQEQGMPFGFDPELNVGDFNGDSVADLLISVDQLTGTTSSVVWGQMNATTLAPSTAGVPIPGAMINATYAVGDYDVDGIDDVLVVQSPSMTIRLFRGQANGVFAAPFVTNSAALVSPVILTRGTAVDIDADGRPDWVGEKSKSTSGTPNQYVHVLRNAGPPSFFSGAATEIEIPVYAVSPIPRVFADFDGDGDMDFIAVSTRYGQWANVFGTNPSVYGIPCPGAGGAPRLSFDPPSLTASAWTVELSNGFPGSIAVLLASLGQDTSGGCVLIDTNPGALILPGGQLIVFPLDGAGYASITANLTSLTFLSGVTLYFQGAVVDPSSSFVTNSIPFAMTAGRSVTYF